MALDNKYWVVADAVRDWEAPGIDFFTMHQLRESLINHLSTKFRADNSKFIPKYFEEACRGNRESCR